MRFGSPKDEDDDDHHHDNHTTRLDGSPYGHPPCRMSCIADPFTGRALSVLAAARLTPSTSSWKLDDPQNFTNGNQHHDEAVTTVREFAMVMMVDRQSQQVLLQVPNPLDWKFHFGTNTQRRPTAEYTAQLEQTAALSMGHQALSPPAESSTTPPIAESSSAAAEPQQQQSRLRPIGLLLFSFLNDVHDPMRVWMYEYTVDPQQQSQQSPSIQDDAAAAAAQPPATGGAASSFRGKWYPWNELPYDKMWADDILWMPQLLWQNEHIPNEKNHPSKVPSDSPIPKESERADTYLYVEGHFVFDGPPGNGTPLHTCQYHFRSLPRASFVL